MKRRTLLVMAALLLLGAVALYLHFNSRPDTTTGDESRQFAFPDTAAITSIFIADKEGNRSEVRRTPKGWVVNDKYPCRPDAIFNLLEVIRNVDVKMPVPKPSKENVIKIMASLALKVEVYKGDELVRQFYVGHETADGEGSFMLLTDLSTGKNFSDPYICYIPGFTGYLAPRFIAKEQEWRDRLVINYIPPQITSVKMTHAGLPDSSFTIELMNTTTFSVTDGRERSVDFDENKVKQYLQGLQNISYEVLISGMNPRLLDSLDKAGPFCKLVVSGKFKEDTYLFYRKQFLGDVIPDIGVTYEHDPDRLYMRFNGGRDWALCQYFVFGKLLQNASYFQRGQSVKK